jgi:sensor histidine kinase YesM
MKKERTKRIIPNSLSKKLMLTSSLAIIMVIIINIVIHLYVNEMTGRVAEMYVSNVSFNELQTSLGSVQKFMKEYLQTKNTNTLKKYFEEAQSFEMQLQELNFEIVNDNNAIMEKNLRNKAYVYLELTDEAIQAKRGRNIKKYKELYEEATKYYQFLNNEIFTLNNSVFKTNTDKYSIMLSSMKVFDLLSFVILLTFGGLNIIIINLFVGRFTEPLKNLAEVAYQVADGKLDAKIPETNTKDEIGVVTHSFNKMLKSLRTNIEIMKHTIKHENEMKEKELQMEAHLKEAQLKYLQAQINPHFLFNTLNAGAQLAMMEEADKSYQYIQTVANFFRYNIVNKSDILSLAEEVEMVDNYIYILNVRYGGDIAYVKDIDETLLNFKIPKMTLQPIIENSIKHGISNINRDGKINLLLYRDGKKICISISDNGVGMSKEMITTIYNKKKITLDIEGNGIGLKNVISRLELFYNDDNIVEINSEGKDCGVEVAILLPYLEGEKGNV